MKKVLIIFVLLFLPATLSFAQPDNEYNYNPMIDLIKLAKKSSLILYKPANNEQPMIQAIGFIINIKNVLFLVTATHVSEEIMGYGDTDIYFNTTSGKKGECSINYIKNKLKVDWLYLNAHSADIAMLPLGTDINILNCGKDKQNIDINIVKEDDFLTMDKVSELDSIFFLSYQSESDIRDNKIKIIPILRKGSISLINEDKTFYIDGFAFPGDSGSPVFFLPSFIKIASDGSTIGWKPGQLKAKFIGVISGYIPFTDTAISQQTGRTVFFEDNTGLTKVWSVDFINEIIKQNDFVKQIKRFLIK